MQPYSRLRFQEPVEAALLGEIEPAESLGQLTPKQLRIIHEAGWFRMFVPKALGGLQLSLPEALRIEEALAALDGSLGWTVTLCSGAGLFAGYVDPGLQAALFSGPALCIGGSGMASGTAARVPGGFVVNGSWKYATGAPHLTAFSTNCRIVEAAGPMTDEAGQPVVRSFMFLPSEVSICDDWNVTGMKATASRSFTVKDVFVPADRSFLIHPDAATHPGPVFRYPFLQFAELTLAANFGGMGLAFLEAFFEGMNSHGGDAARRELREARLRQAAAGLDTLLAGFHQAAAASWSAMERDTFVPEADLRNISRLSRELAAFVRRTAHELIPYAGLAAVTPGTRINRVWRDLCVASQHSLLQYPV